MALNDPSKGQLITVAPQYFGTELEFQGIFKSLTDMGPLEHNHQGSTFDRHSDHLSRMYPRGDFKRSSQTQLTSINPTNFGKLVDLYRGLVEMLPDAGRSAFTLGWHTLTSS